MRRLSLAELGLIAANTAIVAGVLFWDWSIFTVLVLYWAESAVIGGLNVLKMLVIGRIRGLFLSVFFAVHFGGFMFGHGMFLVHLFADREWSSLLDAIVGWPLIGLAASHGLSFAINFLGKREFARTKLERQMFEPYKRIFVMHLTLLLGAAMVEFLGAPRFVSVLLVVMKTGVDLRAHRKEHAVSIPNDIESRSVSS